MSGGSSSVDPYHHPVKPKQESSLQKPKRVVISPSGKRKFVYDCAGCGKEFEKDRHRPSQKKYCGDDCRNKAFGALGTAKKGQPRSEQEKKNMSRRQQDAWQDPATRKRRTEGMKGVKKKPPIKPRKQPKVYTYPCTGCGKRFKTKRKRTGKNKFHSTGCRNKWQGTQKKGKTATCANPDCDKKFYKKASRKDRKYCGQKCAKSDPAYWKRVANTKNKKYGRNWEWAGWYEKRPDRSAWDPIANAARKRDSSQCQGCGKKHKKGEKRFPVHHILPRAKGGPDEPWNLITLCSSCHKKTDAKGGPVRYPFESQSKLPDFVGPDEGESVPFL
ncbi:MAG: HNH endonuclease [Candidatus Thorarchaeota archaeon]|nr:HNH endonuclease [Candidatus Thorarchaeota archaeon]